MYDRSARPWRASTGAAWPASIGQNIGDTPGETTSIEYETPDSQWREERARGDDRPETDVKD